MSKLKILAIAAPVVLCLSGVAFYIQYVGSTEAIVERFPEIDPTIVRKISAEMTREAFTGKYSDIDITDENVCDNIFLRKAEQYQK